MAQYNQVGGFSTGNDAYVLGTTSRRENLFFEGDNLSIPPLRGRINFTLLSEESTGAALGYVANSIANPTTDTLWVEKVIVNTITAAASSALLSLGIATAASSSASNITAAGVGIGVAGGAATGQFCELNTSGVFPVAWDSTSVLTAYVSCSSDGCSTGLGMDVDISVFYVRAVTT